MDGQRPDYTVNLVTGDVSGVLVQAGSISGGVHLHLPERDSPTSRSRASERAARPRPSRASTPAPKDQAADVSNTITGNISGTAIQARNITGGINLSGDAKDHD